jgi:hypothetical protein
MSVPILCLLAALTAADTPAPNSTLAGTVRDADDKPIAGAVVQLAGFSGLTAFHNGESTTGPDGRYAITVHVPGNEATVRRVTVTVKGFVPFDEHFTANEPKLRPRKTTDLDFTLARGEPIAGAVDMPLAALARLRGETAAVQVFTLEVRGPSFKQTYRTEPGGRFELWVPGPGRYTLTALDRPHAALRDVPAGSRGLTLTQQYPPAPPEVLAKAFDAFADDFALHYSYLALKKIDWPALRDRYRPRAAVAGSVERLADILGEMLENVRDGHVWIDAPQGRIPTCFQPADPNYNHRVRLDALKEPVACGDFAVVGRTWGDGFGAILMTKQSAANPQSVRQVQEFIRRTHDAPGFLVDLREAKGGNEQFAQDIARLFCAADVVYAKSKYRNGPEPTDFGETYDRVLQATGDRPFTRPVVCLIGPRAVSSGEGFVQMMAALPHVTTVGARTRGSSGNPKPTKLPGIPVTVWYSRWVDLMPDGTPIEGAGIAPAVAVDAPPAAYADKDATWEKALAVLRAKVKE